MMLVLHDDATIVSGNTNDAGGGKLTSKSFYQYHCRVCQRQQPGKLKGES